MKKIKFAVVGLGGRGDGYASYAYTHKNEYNLAAIVDNNPYKQIFAKEKYPGVNVFKDIDSFIESNTECDFVCVATQDEKHKNHAISLMKAGYNLLLEKPIAPTLEDCIAVYNSSICYGKKVIVCHVLRYTTFYRTIKQIIDSGEIGEILNVSMSENIGYWHFAHSYIRGPWRNSNFASPIILAKCCHDLDILYWLTGQKCISVNSIGDLVHFKKGAICGNAKFCTDCKVEGCAYRASNIYKEQTWPNKYYLKGEITEENIMRQLPYTQYDRCVYECDNNVCDNQNTILKLDNNIYASHYLTAHSKEVYRDIKIHGTKGELCGLFEKKMDIIVNPFRKDKIVYNSDILKIDDSSHGGGDSGMMRDLFLSFNGMESNSMTNIESSIYSHLIAFGAEKSRLINGQTVFIRDELKDKTEFNRKPLENAFHATLSLE